MKYGNAPIQTTYHDINLPEMMHYLYLPVLMRSESDFIRLPPNIEILRPLVEDAIMFAQLDFQRKFKYAYVSARKGWASPDNPLNRPGWHSDGFGGTDLNYIWWHKDVPGTRMAVQEFTDISDDHFESAKQFEAQIDLNKVQYPEGGFLYGLDPSVIHATPLIEKNCLRQFVKVSLSDEKYNLADNSHNYLFDYDWKLHDRSEIRNDPVKPQLDYVK